MAPEVCYAFRCLKTHKALDAPDDLSPPSGQTSPTPRHALDAAHRQKNRYESWIDVEASSASGVLKVLSAAWWLGVMRCTLPGAGKLLDFTHRPIDPSPPVATRRRAGCSSLKKSIEIIGRRQGVECVGCFGKFYRCTKIAGRWVTDAAPGTATGKFLDRTDNPSPDQQFQRRIVRCFQILHRGHQLVTVNSTVCMPWVYRMGCFE